MSDERQKVSYEDAAKMLPSKDKVHTFRSSPDWSRKDVLAAIKKHGCELSGPQAAAMKHGLVLMDPEPLFIETVPQ